ncbi:hypothetical protein [Methylorubrum thiocyanatum]|uniref:hypothetical protein n=1 Tax=Methylorubrum thiocyanatum TaxID=47958 RepID=UPI0035C8741B
MTSTTTLSAKDAIATVRAIQQARELVRPLLLAVRDEERRIANADAEGIVHPDADLAALDAAEALTKRYWQIEGALKSSIQRFMGGREDSMEDLLARMEREAEAEEAAKWSRILGCADTVEHELNELLTWADVESFLADAARHPQGHGDEDFVASLGSDAIVVLGDGSVLAWGREHVYGGTTYRDLTVYRDHHSRGQNVLIADVFRDELEGADAA